ncbi:MAG TPA: hypothetical protein VIF32_02630 [Gemmatimonadaceae bacterium]
MTVVEIVERERARLRVVDVAAALALAFIVTATVIGVGAWILGESRWIALPRATPLLVWSVLAIANGAVISLATKRLSRELAQPSVAAAIEREQTLRAGALRGVIEVADSTALARRADRALVAKLSGRGSMLAPRLQRSSRTRALQALGVAAVTLALLLWAAPTLSDGLLAIRRPIAAWRGTLVPPLHFKDLPSALLRGESLRVKVEARGRRRLHLSARATGEGWRGASLAVDSASGVATTTLGPVRGDVLLVASDGRSATDTVIVRVTDRPFVGGVVLRAVYPAYLGRAPEGLPVGEPARVPQGTIIDVAGRASTALQRVYVRGAKDSIAFKTNGHSFQGRLAPAHSVRLDWFAFGVKGPIADVPLPLEIEVIPDSIPRVELVSPATDTLVATTDHIPLQITATDDHGIASVELHTSRVVGSREAGSGKREAIVAQRISGAQGTVWNGTPTVDLAARDLKPGDALTLQIVAIDNSPWAQRGVSRELVLRIPTMEERRSLARSAADSTASEARQTAAAQKSLEQRTDEASRERGARNQNSNGAKGAEAARQREKEMSFESAEKARALAQEQRALTDRVNKLKEAAAKLEEQLRQAAALDTALARQLREAQDLLRDALTPDLLEQMRKLESATRELSGDQARDALKNLAEMQRRLREQLEKSAEMLKRAALEGAMETLKDEAKEIAEKQRALADSSGPGAHEAGGEAESKQQKSTQLADRSERLSKDVKQLEARLERDKATAGAQKAADAERHAAASGQRMRRQDARSASEQMDQAAKDMQAARDQQVAEWKKELTEALDESIQELLQMAREESSIEEKSRAAGRDNSKNEQLRGQQSTVQQGVDKTGERLQREGQKTSLLSGRAQRAMSEAKQRVGQATQQLSEPRGGQQAASTLGEAAEALNKAAAALARDRERANGASSATGFAEMLQQLQEMAKRQGSINAQAQGLMPIPGQGSMSPEAQATARMLARQQRGIAQQLEEMGDATGGDRAGELAKEARQLAEALEQTRVDASTVARQQQLFRRLLDAGRSLEKEEREDNEKREAKAAKGDDRFDPGQGAARGRAASRFREPTWSDLRGLTADERRAILEYFKRINAEKP